MTPPFSTRVAAPQWRRDATAWATAALGTKIDDAEQVRIRPWSTHLRLRTGDQIWWLKANCAAQAFEPDLQAILHQLLPDSFDGPVAIDADRGWLLAADRGQTWEQQHEPGLDQWCELVTVAAHLQRQLVGHREVILGAGLPDCSPSTVLSRFDELVDLLGALPAGDAAHLPSNLRDELTRHRPAIARAVQTLTTSPLPITWQHGDLHPGNVFSADDETGGTPSLFDLGDAQWAHAAEILCVPCDCIADRTDVPWEAVLAAYADAWDLPAEQVAADWSAARITQNVNRALTWWECLQQADDQEWEQWGSAPREHLLRVLTC